MTTTTMRVMCEISFFDGYETFAAAVDEIQAAGLELMISDHPDDIDEYTDYRFGMVWKDFDANMNAAEALRKFEAEVDKLGPYYTDAFGFVDPNHVPTRFGDFGDGERSKWDQ